MTLRRATILVHTVLALVLLTSAAWFVWISVAGALDPEDDWPVGPGFIAMPMAVVALIGAALVAISVRSWMRSNNRATLAIGDLMAGLTLAVAGVLMPTILALSTLGALAVAGATVAAQKPAADPAGTTPSLQTRRSPVVVFLVILAAVVVGVMFVAPMLMSLVTFADAE